MSTLVQYVTDKINTVQLPLLVFQSNYLKIGFATYLLAASNLNRIHFYDPNHILDLELKCIFLDINQF